MRTFSIVTAVITALVLVIVGYAALTTDVGVAVLSTTSEPASNQYEAFTMATTWAKENNTASVTCYTSDEPGDVSQYNMVYLTIEVSNWCYLPAEWLQIRVNPIDGDLLQIRQDSGTARAMGKTVFQAVLVTSAADPTVARQVEVEYYIFGRKYTVTSQIATT